MDGYQTISLIVVMAAGLSYINHRVLKLPTTVGLMALALALSLVLMAMGAVWPALPVWAEATLTQIDFDEFLLHGILGFLLFAGALHVDLNDLAEQKFVIASLATVGVVLSTTLVAAMTWAVTQMVGIELTVLQCLLFGAVISPTDPIAVLGIVKKAGAPRSLETKISGESLFNDGIGVVLFLVLSGIAAGGSHGGEGHGDAAMSASGVLILPAEEVIGGGVLGLIIGGIAYLMLKTVDDYRVEVMITLAVVFGGYAAADALHFSGPLAMVAAGLLIGNHGRRLGMSDKTRKHLDDFWELVDEMLNAVLFVLVGLEVLVVTWTGSAVVAGLVLIPAVLLARFLAVGTPISVFRLWRGFTPHAVKILTWGGLRGGISVALALSLRQQLHDDAPVASDLILTATYMIVTFSIIVQGMTTGPLLTKLRVSEQAK